MIGCHIGWATHVWMFALDKHRYYNHPRWWAECLGSVLGTTITDNPLTSQTDPWTCQRKAIIKGPADITLVTNALSRVKSMRSPGLHTPITLNRLKKVE